MAERPGGWHPRDLSGRIALVTGASRGVGRGVAEVLGECGATVYVSSRSVTGRPSAEGAPGTIEETAELVTAAGGSGIAMACDHGDDQQVADLLAQIRSRSGSLDLLVNNAWGGYERYDAANFQLPFWQSPPELWQRMVNGGPRLQYLTARRAAAIMVEQGSGLIIGTASGDRGRYLGSVVYDVAKAAALRMGWGMARELRPHGVTALMLLPGFTRTEAVMAGYDGDQAPTHSTHYVGRAVAELAADPDVMRHSGEQLRVADVAEQYGFRDVDGRLVPPFELPD
jgi:NAD(P)-dependent dehydrogenase (short-subunit alcohol dehydrogenase family)